MPDVERPTFGSELYRSNRPVGSRLARKVPLPGDVKAVWTALVSHWLTVVAVFCAAMLIAVAYIWVTPPIYTATAEIIIDPRKRDIIDKEIVQSGLGTSSLGPDTFLLDSQVEIMLSESVMRGLIDRAGLLSDPEFVGGAPSPVMSGITSVLKRILRGPQAEAFPETSPYDRALAKLTKRLDIKRKGNTYVFAVSMRSQDPAKAADIANKLVAQYTAAVNGTSRRRIEEASHLLDDRLDALRRAAVESQGRVEAFRNAHGLISAERLTIVEQQLRDLNLQLARVAATANSTRSRWQEVVKLEKVPPDQALASGLLESQSLTALRDRAAALTVDEGSLSMSLMREHPALVALRESRAALTRAIQAEIRRLIARSKYEYDVAKSEEASLRTRISALETATATSNRANVVLAGLQREALANVTIYEQFLGRSKSAREQINLPSETVGVISKAFPPNRPSWPAEPLVLAFAAFLGLVLGVVAAVLQHLSPRNIASVQPVRLSNRVAV